MRHDIDGPEGGGRERQPLIASGVPAAGPRALEEGEWPVGISLSGGGIRSAAFSLGVLQELQKAGLLRGPRRARYLSAVSGGSYIAGATALVALGAMHGEPDAEHVVAAERPFEPGSPEEQYVRNHTTYLLHGPGGVVGFVWRLVLGIALNVAFLALALHGLARPLGWAYGWAYEGLRRGSRCVGARCEVEAGVVVPREAWAVAAVAGAFGVALGLLAIAVRWRDDETRAGLARGSAAAMVAGAVALVVLVGLPELSAPCGTPPPPAPAARRRPSRGAGWGRPAERDCSAPPSPLSWPCALASAGASRGGRSLVGSAGERWPSSCGCGCPS